MLSVECCMSSGKSTNVLANAVGRNDRTSVSVSLTEALSMVFTTESEQKRERKQHILLRRINGVRGRALASHRCGPGSTLGVDAQCGLILSLVSPC